MAVRADQVALRDLVEHTASTVRLDDEGADQRNLLGPGPMIPLHGRVVEDTVTVRTGFSRLQLAIPLEDLGSVTLLLCHSERSGALVVVAVVLAPACLAPRLPTVSATTMEL